MKKKWFLLFLSIATFALGQEANFDLQIVYSGLFHSEVQINYLIDTVLIGSCKYAKISLLSTYIMYDFFVYPEFRNKGYGKKLLEYTCDLLKKIGARSIYIQPGPFELKDGYAIKISNKSEHQKALQRLVKIYNKVGFVKVNWFLSAFAALLYKIVGIDEDANYLLVKSL